jgi:hypothetical protein
MSDLSVYTLVAIRSELDVLEFAEFGDSRQVQPCEYKPER